LTPEFDSRTTSYSATTALDSTTVTATPTENADTVTITVNGDEIENGGEAELEYGNNTIVATVTDSDTPHPSVDYTITVKRNLVIGADADIAVDEDLLGKVVGDLQSDVAITDDAVSGTLAYVDDYTGFSGDPTLQVGNFLALHFECDDATTITAQLIGGDFPAVTLDESGICIFRIKNTSETIKLVATNANVTSERVLTLTDLVLSNS